MIVADATPLIHLARAGRLNLLPKLYGRVVVPASVWGEVRRPEEPRAEAHPIEEAEGSWLEVRKLSPEVRQLSEALHRAGPLGRGEADAIALADSLRLGILMDDAVAVGIARMRGLETRWTTSVILEAVRRGILAAPEARKAVEDLVAAGLWLRQEVLLRILSVLSEP
ncbi:MAG: hypothetical protein ACT4OI_01565 [Methanobacteriota archaeon]